MTEQGGRAGAVEGLDLTKPPKYCPQCQKSDVKSKVKKFRMSDGSLVIMCKSDKVICEPWSSFMSDLDNQTMQVYTKLMRYTSP